MKLKLDKNLKVAKATTHKASPIPQRAKFLRKFNLGGKKKYSRPPPTQEKRQLGVKIEPPREEKRETEVMLETREDVTITNKDMASDSIDTQQPVKEMKVCTIL